MVEAGQTDVKVYPALDKEFVINRVEFVCNVIAKHDRKETSNVAIFGQKEIKTAAAPGDVVAICLCCQCHLRMGEIRAFMRYQYNVVFKDTAKMRYLSLGTFVMAPGNFPPLLV